MPYSLTRTEDRVTFRVDPEETPTRWSLLLLGLPFLAMGAFLYHYAPDVPVFSIPFILMGLASGLIAFSDTRPVEHKCVRKFTVTHDGVLISEDSQVAAQDVHRIVVDDPLSTPISFAGPALAYLTLGSGAAAGFLAGEMGDRVRKELCCSVSVEAGGKALVLGTGLSPTSAHGLATDVAKCLGFEVKPHIAG